MFGRFGAAIALAMKSKRHGLRGAGGGGETDFLFCFSQFNLKCGRLVKPNCGLPVPEGCCDGGCAARVEVWSGCVEASQYWV